METKVLNYRIIIKPAKEGKQTVYLAECPTLGVVDHGETINQALKSIKEGIECHIESLIKDSEEIPADYPEKEFVTEAKKNVTEVLNDVYFGILPDFPDVSKKRTFRKRRINQFQYATK